MIGRWRSLYGENPVHLLAMAGCFALVGYTMLLIWEDPSLYAILLWFLGALLVHDLVVYPLYALSDQVLTVTRWARRRAVPRLPVLVPVINHIRLPALGSALLGLIWLPTLSGRGNEAFAFTAGLPVVGRYENWLWITGMLFAASAVIYVLRLLVALGRRLLDRTRRRSGGADPATPGAAAGSAEGSSTPRGSPGSESPTEALPEGGRR